jgi:BlaI family transcriptional regulator, penicillinase repressor
VPRRPSPTLTDGETRLMNVLWQKRHATVAEVVAGLRKRHPVAYNTVQTLLRILEGKGYVTHEQVGRAFVYWPLIEQQAARRRALSHLMKALFDNSPRLLVLDVLRDERLDPAEIEHLKELIKDA